MPCVEISADDFADWQVCWRVNNAFSAEFDPEQAAWCVKCRDEIPSKSLRYRSLFVSRVVTCSCSHSRIGSLCSTCDIDMVYKITRGEEKCFVEGCNETLRVDSSRVSNSLSSIPKLLEEYMRMLGFDCIVCGEFVTSVEVRSATEGCPHPPNACKDCIGQMIEVAVKHGTWASLSCPETSCRAELKIGDVRVFATDAIYERYDELLLQRTCADMPEYIACQRGADHCTSGQLHPPKDSQPRVVCSKCQFVTCFTHKMPWHEGQSCAQYDFLQTDGESDEYKKKNCKKCPRSGCGVYIEKNGACHEMKCKFGTCQASWCWECKVILDTHGASYSERHKSQHLSSCTAPLVVEARRANSGFRSIAKPTTDGRYRVGWDTDPGFIGTGTEY